MKDFIVPIFVMGFLSGLGLCTLLKVFIDITPVESPMAIHCSSFDSELESYDMNEFNCTNGATFQRDILVK